MRRPRPVLASLLITVAVMASACSGSEEPVAESTGGKLSGPTAPPVTTGGSGPLAAVEVYGTGLSQVHVEGAVQYRQTPPVGGEHAGRWANCGAYADPVPSVNGVHSMEHGAVWITYRPDLPADQVETLEALTVDEPFLLISPWADDSLPSPVVLSAWGRQLGVDSADDPAVVAFMDAFAQGPQTPEPGAPCTGGVGEPDSVSRAPV